MRSPYRANARRPLEGRDHDVARFGRRVRPGRERGALIAAGVMVLAGLMALVPLGGHARGASSADANALAKPSGVEWSRATGRLPFTAQVTFPWLPCPADEACEF